MNCSRTHLLTIAQSERHFEDYLEGEVHEFGSAGMSEHDIIEFGKRYDPQPMHTDPVKAGESAFGALIASGWHTVAVMSRLYVKHYLPTAASLPSPGMDELRWLAPVRPGDQISLRVTVMSSRRSRSKPDRGIVVSRVEVLNQKRETVLTVLATNMMMCPECVREGEH